MATNGVSLFSYKAKNNINANNNLNKEKNDNEIRFPRGDTTERTKILNSADFNIISDEIRCKSTQMQIDKKLNSLKGFTKN